MAVATKERRPKIMTAKVVAEPKPNASDAVWRPGIPTYETECPACESFEEYEDKALAYDTAKAHTILTGHEVEVREIQRGCWEPSYFVLEEG